VHEGHEMRPIPPHLSTVTLQPYADPSIKTMGSGKGQPRNTSRILAVMRPAALGACRRTHVDEATRAQPCNPEGCATQGPNFRPSISCTDTSNTRLWRRRPATPPRMRRHREYIHWSCFRAAKSLECSPQTGPLSPLGRLAMCYSGILY
jgi:hypothetical protein